MLKFTLFFALVVSGSAIAGTSNVSSELSLESTAGNRRATLLGNAGLDTSFRPSSTPPLRLTDGLRFDREGTIPALDAGGGLSSDVRQILALILGFIPGFGIGHLIARDRDGFILFLIIDVALYVLWGIGWQVLKFGPFGYIGGVIWLVVHIIQALDAYASAGGPRIVQAIRERAVELADLGPGRHSAQPTVRAFGVRF